MNHSKDSQDYHDAVSAHKVNTMLRDAQVTSLAEAIKHIEQYIIYCNSRAKKENPNESYERAMKGIGP
jgi:hypothetical protein